MGGSSGGDTNHWTTSPSKTNFLIETLDPQSQLIFKPFISIFIFANLFLFTNVGGHNIHYCIDAIILQAFVLLLAYSFIVFVIGILDYWLQVNTLWESDAAGGSNPGPCAGSEKSPEKMVVKG